ncbi:MAG: hypothetical protein AAGI24_07395 [Pseudomonadota bacterium]
MQLPGFVPAELRQLLQFVPGRGWDAVEWRPLLSSLRQVSTRYVTGQGASALRRSLALELTDVDLQRKLTVEPLHALTGKRDQQRAGDLLLHLYFAQWRVEEGLFIDLRPRFLGLAEGGVLQFAPNGLWMQLRPEFRAGMLALYRSFYSDDARAFESALYSMGMLRDDLPDPAKQELKTLLRRHFGIDQSAQRFSIEAFKQSFDELFGFFLQYSYKLHSDFVVAGFCLITLYITLESLGQCHNVRDICKSTLITS